MDKSPGVTRLGVLPSSLKKGSSEFLPEAGDISPRILSGRVGVFCAKNSPNLAAFPPTSESKLVNEIAEDDPREPESLVA
mmetsp:Transcript_18336/g.33028  ORF Transcript_18336/g.33028 Transcript_18336/m.33028 type:complete len:80 (+) Transcript_18336:162-401(+)